MKSSSPAKQPGATLLAQRSSPSRERSRCGWIYTNLDGEDGLSVTRSASMPTGSAGRANAIRHDAPPDRRAGSTQRQPRPIVYRAGLEEADVARELDAETADERVLPRVASERSTTPSVATATAPF